jgi:phage tail protein X
MQGFETYTTVDGDTVDLIAFRRFGSSTGTTEAIYAANLYLADLGPVLPAGVVIQIPVPLAKPTATLKRLWD